MALASSLPNREQIAAALKKVPLFAGLENRQIERLAQHAVPHAAKPDELLFVEGDGCQGLYVVFSGAVKIFKQSTQGREQVLTVERAGAVVAELPVFDGGPYPASCKAVEPSILLFISKQDFRQSCQNDPEMALKVLASVGGRTCPPPTCKVKFSNFKSVPDDPSYIAQGDPRGLKPKLGEESAVLSGTSSDASWAYDSRSFSSRK